jgi:hypothetical protein
MENHQDNNKNKQLNSMWLIENIIQKPKDKETKTWQHDPAVEKLHNMREQIKNDRRLN